MKLKKRYLFPLLLLIAYVAISSTLMTLRLTDKKIQKHFADKNIPVQIHHQTFQDRSLRYVETGLGKSIDQPLIIFVHGAPGSSDAFFDYLSDSLLLSKARLISVDRPGYGYSEYGKAETSISNQAAAIHFIVNQYQTSKVILVGHSFGGPIVGKCAIDHPEKIDQLLFLAPVNDPNSEKIFWFSHFGKWKLTRWILSKSLKVAADEKFSHIEELKKMESEWSQIKIPVTHMHGGKDNLAPIANIDFSKKHIAPELLKIVEWPKGNHFIPWNHFAEVREELLLCLDK